MCQDGGQELSATRALCILLAEIALTDDCVNAYVFPPQRLLDDNGKLEEGDRVWLSRLRGIMSVSQFEGERALESVTAPIYRYSTALYEL